MDGGDPVLEDISDVVALLLSPEFISIADGVMVVVCRVISFPFL